MKAQGGGKSRCNVLDQVHRKEKTARERVVAGQGEKTERGDLV